MKRFIFIIGAFFLLSQNCLAALPDTYSRYSNSPLVAGDIILAVDGYATSSTNKCVIVGPTVLDQYHPEINISVTSGAELIAFEVVNNLTNGTAASLNYTYQGQNIIQYIEFRKRSESPTVSVWSPSYILKSVTVTSDSTSVTKVPLNDSQFLQLFTPPVFTNSSSVGTSAQLDAIITRLDKLVGDPVNDTYVPDALKGKITTNQYFALMGLSGLVASGAVLMIWSRGL